MNNKLGQFVFYCQACIICHVRFAMSRYKVNNCDNSGNEEDISCGKFDEGDEDYRMSLKAHNLSRVSVKETDDNNSDENNADNATNGPSQKRTEK